MPKAFHTEPYRQFCELLIAERSKAGLTQEEVASRLGKPQSYVSKYEKHERRLDVIEYLDIAEAIGFDPSRLIGRLVEEIKLAAISR